MGKKNFSFSRATSQAAVSARIFGGCREGKIPRSLRRDISFGIAVIISVLIISFCMTETVMGQNRAEHRREKQYYAAMEKEYCADMKELLTRKGYFNSGITIRWILEETGERNYTVMIHHRMIAQLDNAGKEELLQELMETEFQDAACSFSYEFPVFQDF